jgi:hypothetical protein
LNNGALLFLRDNLLPTPLNVTRAPITDSALHFFAFARRAAWQMPGGDSAMVWR